MHGGCTGDTAREIRHLLNAWSEQNGYDETRCAVNLHAWRYYIACMLAHVPPAPTLATARRDLLCREHSIGLVSSKNTKTKYCINQEVRSAVRALNRENGG